MYTHARRSDPDVQELRRTAGEWLANCVSNGASPREISRALSVPSTITFISQLEMGRGRVPPYRYKVWAGALGVPPKVLVKTLLRYYDPVTYSVLFEDETSAGEPVVKNAG